MPPKMLVSTILGRVRKSCGEPEMQRLSPTPTGQIVPIRLGLLAGIAKITGAGGGGGGSDTGQDSTKQQDTPHTPSRQE